MYHMAQYTKFYILSTLCIYVFYMPLRINCGVCIIRKTLTFKIRASYI